MEQIGSYKRAYIHKLLLVAYFVLSLYYSIIDGWAVHLFIMTLVLMTTLIILIIEDRVLRYLLLAAFIIRLILALLQANTAIELVGPGSDSSMFELAGWQNAQAWIAGEGAPRATGAFYYSAFIGALYFIFGRVPFLIQLFSVVFGVAIVFIIYRITLKLTTSKIAAYLALTIATLFPTLNLFSAVILREVYMLFFVLYSFYFFIDWVEEGRYKSMALSGVMSICAGIFHGAMLLISWIQYFLFALYNPIRQTFRITLKNVIVIVGLSLFVFILFNVDVITYRFPASINDLVSLDTFQSLVSNRRVGRTQYLEDLVPFSYFDVLRQTPIRALYFLLAPFPWMIENKLDLAMFFENISYIVMIILSVFGYGKVTKQKRVAYIAMLIIVFTIIFMFSWGTVNYGTAWRHKLKIAPFVIIMASISLSSMFESIKGRLLNDKKSDHAEVSAG